MSRIRPDEFRGTIIVRSRIDSHWRPPFYAKTDFELRVAFDIRLVDHAGRDYFGGEGSYIEPEGADHANVMYGFIDYDHAWPWDEITDPDIRAELYARYTPWNLP